MSDDERDPVPYGPPLVNNLAQTLAVFPLAPEVSGVRKRPREVAPLPTPEAFRHILFPSEEEVLDSCFERLNMDPTIVKRPKPSLFDTWSAQLKSMIPVTASRSHPVRRPRRAPRLSAGTAVASAPPPVCTYMPPNEFGVCLVAPLALFRYQVDAVQWMLLKESGRDRIALWQPEQNGGMLAMQMGMGKTPIAAVVTAATLTQQRQERTCTLYVCPKSLLGTVRYQFEKFLGPQVRVMIYHKEFQRNSFHNITTEQLQQYDVVLTNYSTLVGQMKTAGRLEILKKSKKVTTSIPRVASHFCDFPWFRVFLDESHEVRELRTLKFLAVNALISPRRFCLTGTPICNRLSDMFAQLRFCGLRIPPRVKVNKTVMHEMEVLRMVRFVDYKVAEPLPPKTTHCLYFELSAEERQIYSHYIHRTRDVFQQLEQLTGRERNRKTMEVQGGLIRLMQLCSAPYLLTKGAKQDYDAEEEEEKKGSDDTEMLSTLTIAHQPEVERWLQTRNGPAGTQSSKMNRFRSLMAEVNPSEKVLIFANYTSTLRLAIGAMEETDSKFNDQHLFLHGGLRSGPAREALLQEFRVDPTKRFLFMTLKLGSVGLNLAEANVVIFLETWFSPSALSQGEGRVHRVGQIKPVRIYYLLARGSVEERTHKLAMEKKHLADDVMAQQEFDLSNEQMQKLLYRINDIEDEEFCLETQL
jgi:SNF2 family DNA or RNA helicase